MVRFRVLDLLWKPVGHIVRFLIVHHPVRGTIFLLSTDTSLSAMEILQLYSYRFKIELGFRQAVHILGAYAYHFWMLGMKPLRRGAGDQYLHRTSDEYRAAIRRKMRAYHVYEITPEQLSLLRECLRQIESGWEVNIMQANGSPHGANTMMADTIEA